MIQKYRDRSARIVKTNGLEGSDARYPTIDRNEVLSDAGRERFWRLFNQLVEK